MLKMDGNSSHEDIKVNLFVDKENSNAAMVGNKDRHACDLINSKMSTTEVIGQFNELNRLQSQCPLGSDNIEDRTIVNIKIEPCSDYMESIANCKAASDNDTASETLGTRNGNIVLKNECITEKIIFDLQAVKTEPLEVMAHSITQTDPMFDRTEPVLYIVGQEPEISKVTACKNNLGNSETERSNVTFKEVILSNCHFKPIISDNIVNKDTDGEFVSAPDAGTENKCIHSDSNTPELTVQQLEVQSVDLPSSNVHLQDSSGKHPYMVTDGCDKVMQTIGKEEAVTLRETCKSNGFVEGISAVAGCSNLDDVIIIDQSESSNLMDYRSSDNVIVVHDSSDSSLDDSDDEEKDCEKPSEPTETGINKIISNEREDVLEQERNIKLNRYGFEDIRTKGELLPEELPPLEELTITVDESVYMEEVGHVKSIVGILVVIQSSASVPPLDDDTILFVEGHKVLGQVFEVFGPVKTPWYSVRFNQEDNIAAKGIHVGMKVYCALRENSFTKFVFMDCLKAIVGSDASWEDNNEPPEKHLDYSDDEAERMAKAKKKHKRSRENGADGGEDAPKKYRNNQKDRAQQSPRPGYQRQQQQPQLQSVASKCGGNPFQRTSYNNNTNMTRAGHYRGNRTTRYSHEDNRGQTGQDFNTPASRFGGPPNFQNRRCLGSGFKQNTETKQLQTNAGHAFSQTNTGQPFSQTNTGQAFSQTNTGQAFCQTNTGQAFSTQSQSNQGWLFGNVSHTSMLREQTHPAPVMNSQYQQGPFCHKGLPDFTKPPPNLQSPPPYLQSHGVFSENRVPIARSHGMFNENRVPIAQRNANTPGCNQLLNTAHFQDWGHNVTFPTTHYQVPAADLQSGTRSLSSESTANIQPAGNGKYQVSTSSRKRIPIHYLNTRSSADQPDKRTPGQFEEISVSRPSQSSYRQLEAQNTHSVNNGSIVNDRDVLYTMPAAVRSENTSQWASKPNSFNPSRY